jgi:hypothetical protein
MAMQRNTEHETRIQYNEITDTCYHNCAGYEENFQ